MAGQSPYSGGIGPQKPPEIPDQDNQTEGDDFPDEEGEEEEEAVESPEAQVEGQRKQVQKLIRRLSSEQVHIRVHDITIKGNNKTKDFVIEAEVEEVKNARTMQELVAAAGKANARLRNLGIFESATITLDAGPPELPDTANVIVEVQENTKPFSGDIGIFSKPEARTWTVEGSLKYKNGLGYGETWDGTGSYGWDKTSEMSAGLSYPRFRGLPAALMARASLLTEDWLKFSSYKERMLGLSIGLSTDEHHDLTYNLTWRSLMDPSHKSSRSIHRQLGHSLLSSVKYSYKIDLRDSHVRPTRGFAFASTSQIAGLGPDSRLLRFVRQELDFRYAIPLGFYKAALNVGLSGGILLPWGKGFQNLSTPVPDRFFMGGHSSPVCNLRGPTSLLGFRTRGIGSTDVRRSNNDSSKRDDAYGSSESDSLGGDLAVTSFADLSFDLPLKLFRDAGIHGHCFICAGNLTTLTGDGRQPLSMREFGSSFRCSAGAGIIIPTRLFRIEINYCKILRQLEHDHAKLGIQFNFSSPS
uniref:TSA: Wollemia nobilis Ref_Wollemi_Transcript_19492_2091 transcribed RNA sequence n=1 Tax=Wollemia nobilis TaxID=56998 RepID=A0A0C9QN36_9CONI